MSDDFYERSAERAERVIAMLAGDLETEALEGAMAAAIAAETVRTLLLHSAQMQAHRKAVALLMLDAAISRAHREALAYLEENDSLAPEADPS